MIKSFICEIDKQISSNIELYNQTHFDVFRERFQKLIALKKKILAVMQDCESSPVNFISSSKN
jgi:iron-sulfur cluster repair protein YtfE (RIC family)